MTSLFQITEQVIKKIQMTPKELVNKKIMNKEFDKITDEEFNMLNKSKFINLIRKLDKQYSNIENYILKKKNPYYVHWYAYYVIKSRWKEAEPFIMKNPYCAYLYAHDVIKGRWKEAEPFMMKNSYWAHYYAQNIIKGRWKEAEPFIKQNVNLWNKYKEYFGIND